jgi:hypothetical protein
MSGTTLGGIFNSAQMTLSRAADILTSGHELLRTHVPTAAAVHAGRSRWARVIGSAQVAAALVEEISHQAAHAGEVADQLAARSRDNGATCDPEALAALRAAGHWLRQCGHIPGTRTRSQPGRKGAGRGD